MDEVESGGGILAHFGDHQFVEAWKSDFVFGEIGDKKGGIVAIGVGELGFESGLNFFGFGPGDGFEKWSTGIGSGAPPHFGIGVGRFVKVESAESAIDSAKEISFGLGEASEQTVGGGGIVDGVKNAESPWGEFGVSGIQRLEADIGGLQPLECLDGEVGDGVIGVSGEGENLRSGVRFSEMTESGDGLETDAGIGVG